MRRFGFLLANRASNRIARALRRAVPLAIAVSLAVPGGAAVAGELTETKLYALGNRADPQGGVAVDRSGNLYGVTAFGGSERCRSGGCGVVYQLSPPKAGSKAWRYSDLHVFEGTPGKDGARPYGRPLIGRDGALYGTTTVGGAIGAECPLASGDLGGCGTVWKLSRNKDGKWTYEILYSFQGEKDGEFPDTALSMDEAGVLYGTTLNGGLELTDDCFLIGAGCGTVFSLTPPPRGKKTWTKTTIHFFNRKQGMWPYAITLAGDGTIYGTTTSSRDQMSNGLAYRLSPPAKRGGKRKFSAIYSFRNMSDNEPSFEDGPFGALSLNRQGDLFGVDAGGAIYRLKEPADPKGVSVREIVQAFDAKNEVWPQLSVNSAGMVMGATSGGEVFKLLPPRTDGAPWRYHVLETLAAAAGSPITLGKAGRIYGVAATRSGRLPYVFELAP